MEKFTLFLWMSLTFPPTVVLPFTQCVREENRKCSWSCMGVGKVNFQEDNSPIISIICAEGNVYTIDLCGDVPCREEAGVMACSNVTGPAMYLSTVNVTLEYNKDQPNKSQINILDSKFFIALNEGNAVHNMCFEISSDAFQAFLLVEKLPIDLPVAPVPQPVGAIVGGVLGGAVGIVCVVSLLLVCVVFGCRRRRSLRRRNFTATHEYHACE